MGTPDALGPKPANFGPLKQDPMAYQNALNSQKNFQLAATE